MSLARKKLSSAGNFCLRLFIMVSFFFWHTVRAQYIANYVTNGGFEKHDACNDFIPYLNHATGWRTIDSSIALAVQYFNKCLNNVPYGHTTSLFQYPYKGESFGGAAFFCPPCVTSYSRGYFRNRLKSKLTNGTTYCVKLYYNVSNVSSYGLSDIQAYFGDDQLDTIKQPWYPLTYLNPQIKNAHGNYATDTLKWVALAKTFTAQGNEKHMVIGNFTANNLVDSVLINPGLLPNKVTDICIDHVSCIPIDLNAYAGPDKACVVGDSVFVGREPDVEIDESCIWYKLNSNGTLSAPIDTVAGLYVKPVVTTTYVVRQQLWCSGVKWDTVVVYQDFVGLNKLQMTDYRLQIYPVPAQDVINLIVENEKAFKDFNQVEIYNHLGQLIRVEEIHFKEKTLSIKTENLPDGVYSLNLKGNNTQTVSKRFVISR